MQCDRYEVRPVGLERRYARQDRMMAGMARAQQASKKISITASHRQGWSGNVHLGAVVCPKTRRFEDEYHMSRTSLGSGMSGDVFLARPVNGDGGLVAVKTLEKTGLSKKDMRRLLTEVDIYLHLDHCNIARLLQVFDETERIYLVMEHCSGGTLDDRLKQRGRFDEKEVATAIRQVLNAVAYCHGRPGGKVVHSDLKLKNFVYHGNGQDACLKLVDFGLSRVLFPWAPAIRHSAGTLEFMAPEVVRDEQHGEACDVWSVGMIAYNLLVGDLPFHGNEEEVEKAILEGDWLSNESTWSGMSESAKAFVKQLLNPIPTERPSAETALTHPWLDIAPCQHEHRKRPSLQTLKSIEQFANDIEIRRACSAIAVHSDIDLQGDDILEAEMDFKHLDLDGNGVISRQELTSVLQELLGFTLEKCDWIFKRLDIDGNQEIQRTEFLAAVVGARYLRQASKVRHAFDCFDLTKDGKIELGELTGILGENFCGMSTKKIFSGMDANGDRQVDFSEFAAMVGSEVGV